MAKVERVREVLKALPNAEYWREKADAGWRPIAVEWERDVEGTEASIGLKEEVPYGLTVADDCLYLIENSTEVGAMRLILEQIVLDKPLSAVAEELNRRGFRQRSGTSWNQVAVFNILPRIIEVAPRIYSSDEWNERRAKLRMVVG